MPFTPSSQIMDLTYSTNLHEPRGRNKLNTNWKCESGITASGPSWDDDVWLVFLYDELEWEIQYDSHQSDTFREAVQNQMHWVTSLFDLTFWWAICWDKVRSKTRLKSNV